MHLINFALLYYNIIKLKVKTELRMGIILLNRYFKSYIKYSIKP